MKTPIFFSKVAKKKTDSYFIRVPTGITLEKGKPYSVRVKSVKKGTIAEFEIIPRRAAGNFELYMEQGGFDVGEHVFAQATLIDNYEEWFNSNDAVGLMEGAR